MLTPVVHEAPRHLVAVEHDTFADALPSPPHDPPLWRGGLRPTPAAVLMPSRASIH
jgi:hypothetical protein